MLTKRYNSSLIAIWRHHAGRPVVNQQKLRNFFFHRLTNGIVDRSESRNRENAQGNYEKSSEHYCIIIIDVMEMGLLFDVKMNLGIVHCITYWYSTMYVILVAKCVTRIFFPLQVTLGESRKTSFFIHCEKLCYDAINCSTS